MPVQFKEPCEKASCGVDVSSVSLSSEHFAYCIRCSVLFVLCCVVFCEEALDRVVLHCAVMRCVLCCAVPCRAVPCYAVLCCAVPCAVLCRVLCCCVLKINK